MGVVHETVLNVKVSANIFDIPTDISNVSTDIFNIFMDFDNATDLYVSSDNTKS